MYRLNANPDAVDVVHQEHPYEECNVDDAKGVTIIDHEIALQRIADGSAVWCRHCLPEGASE